MKFERFARTLAGGLSIIFLVCGCATETPSALSVAETPSPSATRTASPAPTQTPTRTSTVTPTGTSTGTPSSTATASPRRTPTFTPTRSVTPGPSPTHSPADLCASLVAKGTSTLYVIYIHPVPDLVWDPTPRYFQVGLCNTIPPSSTPQGKYKIVLNFPAGNRGLSESSVVRAELKPGLNEISVGPWIPGLENHRAVCAQRAAAETQVMYNDTPDPFFHPLLWQDGSDRVLLPIQCGGDYP